MNFRLLNYTLKPGNHDPSTQSRHPRRYTARPGTSYFVIDYGMHQNSCWIVALEHNGIIKHFDCNDVMAVNYTYGMNLEKHHPEGKKTEK